MHTQYSSGSLFVVVIHLKQSAGHGCMYVKSHLCFAELHCFVCESTDDIVQCVYIKDACFLAWGAPNKCLWFAVCTCTSCKVGMKDFSHAQ